MDGTAVSGLQAPSRGTPSLDPLAPARLLEGLGRLNGVVFLADQEQRIVAASTAAEALEHRERGTGGGEHPRGCGGEPARRR